MKCPRCRTMGQDSHLSQTILGNIEVDFCLNCGGIWFDKQELGQTIELSKEEVNTIISKLSDAVEFDKSNDVELKCPKCDVPMNKYRYMYTSNIYIDGCDLCEGVWLDKNELISIMNYLSEASKEDPEKEAQVIAKVKQIKLEYELREREFVDSLVKMDDTAKNPISRAFGEVLQSIYSFFYKIGL